MSEHIQKQIDDINKAGLYKADYGQCDYCQANDVIANVEGETWICEACFPDWEHNEVCPNCGKSGIEWVDLGTIGERSICAKCKHVELAYEHI